VQQKLYWTSVTGIATYLTSAKNAIKIIEV